VVPARTRAGGVLPRASRRTAGRIHHPAWDPSWSVPGSTTIDDLGELGFVRVEPVDPSRNKARTFSLTMRGRAQADALAEQAVPPDRGRGGRPDASRPGEPWSPPTSSGWRTPSRTTGRRGGFSPVHSPVPPTSRHGLIASQDTDSDGPRRSRRCPLPVGTAVGSSPAADTATAPTVVSDAGSSKPAVRDATQPRYFPPYEPKSAIQATAVEPRSCVGGRTRPTSVPYDIGAASVPIPRCSRPRFSPTFAGSPLRSSSPPPGCRPTTAH